MPARPTEYDHDVALAKRDFSLGEAFEGALATNQPYNVYHKDGEYKVGPDSETLAVMAQGWMCIAQVSA